MYKHISIIVVFLIGLLSSSALAAENVQEAENLQENELTNQSNFFIKLSVDNHIKSSQAAATDVAFSAISSLAYINNYFDLSDNILARLGFGYAAFFVTLLNHEISGHGLKAIEFDGKIDKIDLTPISGETSYTPDYKSYHIQKEALVSLSGNEVNYLLSQKIFNNLAYHSQELDPITSLGYIFSAGNQMFYAYAYPATSDGHDLKKYSRDMDRMYGNNSMSLSKIRKVSWLDGLDPLLWASLYSAVTGNNTDIPMIKICDVGFTPFARAVLTPYGAIEKKLGLYIFTDYTPIRLGFSLGKQSKTTSKIEYTNSEIWENIRLSDKGVDLDNIGTFNGLKPGESMKKYFTYSIDMSILKLLTLDKFVLGVDAVLWNQPKLFTSKPYFEKPKVGGMVVLNGHYTIGDSFTILAKLGYKTSGFVPGHHLDKTPIVSLGFEQKIKFR